MVNPRYGLATSSAASKRPVVSLIDHPLPFSLERSIQPLINRESCYLSSQTSSMRAPLEMLLTMIVSPFTRGCQQVARRS